MPAEDEMSEQINLKYGERRNATVLFSDMKGFSSLTEQLDPEEIDGMMTTIFSTFEEIVTRFDGSVEKYIGDALVAVFGVPRIHEDDASRAIHAALEFKNELERRQMGVSFRTGIHTGLVTTGRRGSFEVVTGHAMSVASRLESAAPAGAVLVSAETLEECGGELHGEFVVEDRLELEVKGSSETVAAYRVLKRRLGPSRYGTPFVGRQDLISGMLKLYLGHDSRRVGGACVQGPAGIGKSRLVSRLLDRIREVPEWDAPVFYSRARRFRTLPFAGINDLILGSVAVTAYDPAVRIERELAARLSTLPAPVNLVGDEPDATQLASRYAAFVSRQEETSEGDAFVLIHRIFAWLLGGTGSVYSPIVFIDNFHHIDRGSADFFRYFVNRTTLYPFFIFVGREDFITQDPPFPELTRFSVAPLDAVESSELIGSLWSDRESEERAQQIIAHTGGVPLFIEEYVRYARNRRPGSGAEDPGLPPSIQTIMLASVEAYERGEQEFLKKLSIFERSFTFADAEAIQQRTDGEPQLVRDALDRFVADGHLVCESGVYHFRQELFKRTLYESILNFNKRILHGVVADWIREHDDTLVKSQNLLLLHHLARAERMDELKEAFFKDVRHIHTPEFLPYIELLLEGVDEEHPDYFKFLFTRYAILFNTRSSEGTEEILQSLIATCISRKQPEFAARVYQVLCAEHLISYDYVTAAEYGRRAVQYFQSVDPAHRSLGNTRENLASALLFDGKLDENLEIVERIEGKGSGYDSRTSAMVKRHLHLGEYGPAVELLEGRLQASDPDGTEFLYGGHYMFCLILHAMHDYPRLDEYARLLLRATDQSTNFYAETYAMLATAQSRIHGEHAGTDAIRQAEYYRFQIRSDVARLEPLHLIAVAKLVAGDLEGAEPVAEEALRIAIRLGARRVHFAVSVLLAEISSLRGDDGATDFYLGEATCGLTGFPDLNRQDLAIYYYLRSGIEANTSADEELNRARRLLGEECACLGRPELCRWFLGTRSFGSIDPNRASGQASA